MSYLLEYHIISKRSIMRRESDLWRGGRVAEGAPLLREYTLIAYRGFESLSLRQITPH